MDEKQKTELYKFFSISSVIFFVIYFIFMAILIFSLSVSMPIFLCLMLVMFFLFIIQDTINEKIEELGDIDGGGFLSLPSFTVLIVLYYAVMVYYLRIKEPDTILWAVLALFDSTLLNKSLRALRKLKQD